MSNGDIKIYIINFTAAGVNLAALNQYLYDSADIIAFWNYVPLVYCVKSRSSATELSTKLRAFFPALNYFVAEINPHNLDGLLPKVAWEWFYLDHHEKHRPPALTLGLGGLGLLGQYSPLGPSSDLSALAGLLSPPKK
jgi:hypothetical protein